MGEPGADEQRVAASADGGESLDRALEVGFEPADDEPGERPGSTLGRYTLIERLGEGGFGTVFRALQREPVEREVALKIIKQGMDTRQVIARFMAEQQALARMDHPGVARVFDAGATERGRPYFVMELVEGVPVTRYCDERRLDTTARIELFLAVCQAVQHAHNKGLIHRDLKPSNVLVAAVDGAAMPKVIDFGIAKATGGEGGDGSVLTEAHQIIGTPAYMSPEQADPGEADIDTRADVYSLGVLLYELLTGARPFAREMSSATGYHEVLRIIREVEPRRPSLGLETGTDDSSQVAEQRRATPRTLARLLHGELDWIVLKALAKDRERRYETVDALAADLRRFLANEPVSARAPSRVYLLRKFVRRNRVGMTAAALVLLSLVAGLVVSLDLYGKSERARAAETRERTRAEEALTGERGVSDFLSDLLSSARPEKARNTELSVREILDEAAATFDERFAGRPHIEARLRRIMSVTYERLALYPRAIEHGAEAVRIARSLGEEHAPLLAECLGSYGVAVSEAGDLERAHELHREALAILREHPDAISLGYVLANLATELAQLGRDEEAIPLVLEGIEVGELVRARSPRHCLLPRMHSILAGIREREGRYEEAEALQRRAIDIASELRGPEDRRVAIELVRLVELLLRRGRLDEAEDALARIAAIQTGLYGEQGVSRIEERMAEADLLAERGELEGALALHIETLGLARRELGEDHYLVAMTLNNMAGVLWRLDRLDAAEEALVASIELHRETRGEEGPNVASGTANLAVLRWAAGRYEDAEAAALEALELQARRFGDDSPELIPVYGVLAGAHLGLGELEEAEEMHLAAQDLAESLPEGHLRRFTTRAGYGSFLLDVGRYEEAESELLYGIDGITPLLGDGSTRTREVLDDLVTLYEALGREDEAARWRERRAAAGD